MLTQALGLLGLPVLEESDELRQRDDCHHGYAEVLLHLPHTLRAHAQPLSARGRGRVRTRRLVDGGDIRVGATLLPVECDHDASQVGALG